MYVLYGCMGCMGCIAVCAVCPHAPTGGASQGEGDVWRNTSSFCCRKRCIGGTLYDGVGDVSAAGRGIGQPLLQATPRTRRSRALGSRSIRRDELVVELRWHRLQLTGGVGGAAAGEAAGAGAGGSSDGGRFACGAAPAVALLEQACPVQDAGARCAHASSTSLLDQLREVDLADGLQRRPSAGGPSRAS